MHLLHLLIWLALLTVFPGLSAGQQERGLLWSVVMPGHTDTSYLLGTLHKYPKAVVSLPTIVEEKLGKCNLLYLEMQLDWKMALKMVTGGSPSGEIIRDGDQDWTEKDWAAIEDWFVNVQHMSKADFDQIKSQASSPRLTDMYLKLYGYEYAAVETDLKGMAKKKKMPIKGLDRDWGQIKSWYAYYAHQGSDFWGSGNLDSLLADGYYGLADLFISYAIQDTASLGQISSQGNWEDGLSLVEWRNRNWMKQLPKLMLSRAFVAVGAAHLFGPRGVVALLTHAGFDCSPVEGHFGGEKLERFIRRNSRQYQLAESASGENATLALPAGLTY